MKNRLAISLVFLALLGGLAMWKVFERADNSAPKHTEEGSPDPSAAIVRVSKPDVTTLVVKGPDNPEPVHLEKKGDAWRVTAPVDAEADPDAVDTALEKLAGLEVRRVAGKNPANHERLGVSDAKAVRVTAKNGDKVLVDLLVGGYGGGDTMVRKPGEDTVYAVAGSISYAFSKELRSWREREILDVDAKNVVEVEWVDGKDVKRFVRAPGATEDSKAWLPAKGQKAIKNFSASKVQTMVASLAKIRATDFAAAATAPEAVGIGPDAPRVTLMVEAPAGPGAAGTGAADPKADAGTPPAKVRTTHVIRLGKKGEGGTTYHVMVEGDPTVYLVNEYLSKRIQLEPKALEDDPNAEPAPPPVDPHGGAMPMPGGGPPGGQIPPELLQQIQAQMRAQQGQ